MKAIKSFFLVALLATITLGVASCSSKTAYPETPAGEYAEKIDGFAKDFGSVKNPQEAMQLKARMVSVTNQFESSDYELTDADRTALKAAFGNFIDAFYKMAKDAGIEAALPAKSDVQEISNERIDQATTLGEVAANQAV